MLTSNVTNLLLFAFSGGVGLTEREKEAVGWRCKRLIDHGRLLYLQQHGLQAKLKVYIHSHQTPENVVLVATP